MFISSLKDLYDKDWESHKIGSHYTSRKDRGNFFSYNHRFNKTVELFPDVNKSLVLDLGSGCGVYAIHLSRKGAKIYSIDISKNAIINARGLCKNENVKPNCPNFLNCSGTELPFKDHSFDFVLCLELIEHIPDHMALMKEIRRVLKRNGILVISFPSKYSVREFLDSKGYYKLKSRVRFGVFKIMVYFYSKFISKKPKSVSFGFFQQHLHFFSYYDIKKLMKRNGFEIECDNYSLFFYPLINHFVGRNKVINNLWIGFESLLSKTIFRNLAWNVNLRCRKV
jgi:ubiquinone/menaquinone biosynthesis C-methylase UbiE